MTTLCKSSDVKIGMDNLALGPVSTGLSTLRGEDEQKYPKVTSPFSVPCTRYMIVVFISCLNVNASFPCTTGTDCM